MERLDEFVERLPSDKKCELLDTFFEISFETNHRMALSHETSGRSITSGSCRCARAAW